MAAIVVQVSPSAWAAIEQLPEIHRTVPSKAHGKHVLKPTVQQTFTFKPTVQIPHIVHCSALLSICVRP